MCVCVCVVVGGGDETLRHKECVMSIIEIIRKPEIYCKQFYNLPVSFIIRSIIVEFLFMLLLSFFFPPKPIRLEKY